MAKVLDYGGVPEEECEVVVRLDKQDGLAHISSTWAPMSRKLEKRYGAPCKVSEREGKWTVAFWTIPAKLISFRKPRTTSILPRQSRKGMPFPGNKKPGGRVRDGPPA